MVVIIEIEVEITDDLCNEDSVVNLVGGHLHQIEQVLLDSGMHPKVRRVVTYRRTGDKSTNIVNLDHVTWRRHPRPA